MDKDELRAKEGRTIPVWIPQVFIDWMDQKKLEGRYLHYAEPIREGLSLVKGQDDGDVLVSKRSRDY